MAFDFPSSPSDGQVFTPAGGPSYTYNAAGTKWLVSATTFTGQPLDALLTSIAALTFGADNYIYGTGSDTAAAGTVSSFMRTVLDDATGGAARTTLGINTGIFTPTLNNVANLDASNAFATAYLQISDRVIVWGVFQADATAAASTLTTLGMSLPIASNFASSVQLGGAATVGTAAMSARVFADTTADQAVFDWLSTTTGNVNISFIFGYTVI